MRNLSLGPLTIENASLTLSGFDQASGVYAKAGFFVPAAMILGGDVYGLTLDISGLSAASASLRPFVPAGVAAVKVSSARISEYAVERFLADRYPFLTDMKINLDGHLGVNALARGRRLHADFELSIKDGTVLEAKPLLFVLGPFTMSPYLLQLFTFRLDFSDNPYGIRVSGLRKPGR